MTQRPADGRTARGAELPAAAFSLSPEDVTRLIAAAPEGRDRALIRLLAETGLRRREAASLRGRDVDAAARLLVVREGKGRKTRVVPVTVELLEALRAIRTTDPADFVFRSRQRQSLSVRQINRIVAGVGAMASVRHPNPHRAQVTCHLLRHTFARQWKAHRGSIESLSKILGHSSVKTTWDVYGTESLQDVQRNYDTILRAMQRGDARDRNSPEAF